MCRLDRTRGKNNTREGAKSGVGRHKRIKRGRGTQGRDERSNGIDIRIADAFAIIKPTAPLRLAKHEARRKRPFLQIFFSSAFFTCCFFNSTLAKFGQQLVGRGQIFAVAVD